MSCESFQTKYIEVPTPILPPDSLLQNCPHPIYTGKTWADVVEHTIDYKEALEKCNIDKKALRDFKEANSIEDNKDEDQ